MIRVLLPKSAIEPTPTRDLRQKVDIFHPRSPQQHDRLSVRALPRLPSRPPCANLAIGPLSFRCVVGRGGIGVKRREGDFITPVGKHRITSWLARFDRRTHWRAGCQIITKSSGWCDDPRSYTYNRLARLPFPWRTETLWREDHLYDIIGVIDFNACPRVRGRGSAIFIHIARDDFAPTAGCVALPEKSLSKIKPLLSARTRIVIGDVYCRRSPKIADPTRIAVEPNCTAKSKSALMPIESSPRPNSWAKLLSRAK